MASLEDRVSPSDSCGEGHLLVTTVGRVENRALLPWSATAVPSVVGERSGAFPNVHPHPEQAGMVKEFVSCWITFSWSSG